MYMYYTRIQKHANIHTYAYTRHNTEQKYKKNGANKTGTNIYRYIYIHTYIHIYIYIYIFVNDYVCRLDKMY